MLTAGLTEGCPRGGGQAQRIAALYRGSVLHCKALHFHINAQIVTMLPRTEGGPRGGGALPVRRLRRDEYSDRGGPRGGGCGLLPHVLAQVGGGRAGGRARGRNRAGAVPHALGR